MRELKWNPAYSVSVKKFDDQHVMIIDLLNRIIRNFDPKSPPEELGSLLDELANYAQIHFSSEEQLLEKHQFHGLETHIAEHRLYERKIAELQTRLVSADDQVTTDLLEFLADWWMGHIQGCDKDYSRYLNNCGVF